MSREYFVAICTSCGNQAQVPFKPRMDKPVYCSDCFRNDPPGLTRSDATPAADAPGPPGGIGMSGADRAAEHP